MTGSVAFNSQVKLVLADVDETIAEVYCPAEKPMIEALAKLLDSGAAVFFITGGSLQRVKIGIIDPLPQGLRLKTLVAHCSGAEIWGFDRDGDLHGKPYYSKYEEVVTEQQKQAWRQVVDQLIQEFRFKTHPVMPKLQFKERYGDDPLEIMLDDRGPQITLELINAADLSPEQTRKLEVEVPQTHGQYDLRIPVLERADVLFKQHKIPVTSRLGGTMALDFAIEGVSKTTAIKYVLGNEAILSHVGLEKEQLKDPRHLEIWGDKFSTIRGGTDRLMCEAVDKRVRAIDFRQEDLEELPKGYNIVLWDGDKHLHHGTLEYLQSSGQS